MMMEHQKNLKSKMTDSEIWEEGTTKGGIKGSTTQQYRIRYLPDYINPETGEHFNEKVSIEHRITNEAEPTKFDWLRLRFDDPDSFRMFVFKLVKCLARFEKKKGLINDFNVMAKQEHISRDARLMYGKGVI